MKRTIVIDLDGTLTIDDKSRPYHDKEVNQGIREATTAAQHLGWGVQVLTARQMRTYNNNRALIEKNVRPVAETWLDQHDIACDALHVAKPWCGPGGVYVDDRNLHLEEYRFKFTGPFADTSIWLRAKLSTPPAPGPHPQLRIERWLEVSRVDLGLPATQLPAPLCEDARLEVAVEPPWTLWTEEVPGLSPPAAWFTVYAHRLDARRPAAHIGGQGIAPFALVPTGPNSLEEALALASTNGFTTRSAP